MGLWTPGSFAQQAKTTFQNPASASGADPWVIRWEDRYWICQSRRQAIWVKGSQRLQDIGRGEWSRVWTPPREGPYSKELWAPELHRLEGKWWIYVAADNGDNANHRMYVLEGPTGEPTGAFSFKGKVAAPTDRWAIDATILQMPGGKLYMIWSGWEGTENVAQHLYIAPMSNPWTISGERVRISSPEEEWEKRGDPHVNEGPEVLWNGDRLFIAYSASGSWTDDYCLGLLAWKGGDVLDPSKWVKSALPVFSKTDAVFGPGHCSFVKSRDGKEDWIIYHSAKRKGGGWDRRVNMQRFTWKEDGTPDFGKPIPAGVEIPEPSGDSVTSE